ncbi:MAG: hypothetical protein AMS22_02410 [Thiotrichales bacterium SG8_50]|nr:MAG: hypothetical protein AMS22_02410 [Thiotrichales bacterium SG8_50]
MALHAKLLVLAAYLWASASWAADPQPQLPIEVQADRVTLNEKTGTSEYSGDVRLTQGPISINAERLVVQQEERKIARLVIEGQPAQFEQAGGDGQEAVRAEARRMEYDAAAQKLYLTNEVKVWHGRSQFQGERIEYDARKRIVYAGSAEGGKERIQAIIHPSEVQKETKP